MGEALAWGAVLCVMLCPVLVAFDIDVSIPAGSPLAWRQTLPSRTVRAGPPVPAVTGGPRAPFERRYADSRGEILLPSRLGFMHILTADVSGHLSWTAPRTNPPPALTGAHRIPYPPRLSLALYWVSISTLLRMTLHPEQTSRAESLAYLLELGDGAYPAASAARAESALAGDATWLVNAIGRPPPGSPRVSRETRPVDTMMSRFVADELVSANPYDPALQFGRRLFLLGDLVAPYVAKHTQSDHSFLRRNAIAALGRFAAYPSAVDPLVRIVTGSSDRVAFVRATTALARLREPGSVMPLVGALGSEGSEVEIVTLVHGLGSLGDGRAVPALIAAARRKGTFDVTLAVLIALARLPGHDDEVEDLAVQARRGRLSKVGRRVRNALPPDHPDPEGVRREIMKQAALFARAAHGEDDSAAGEEMLALGEGESLAADRRWRFQNRSLGAVHPLVAYAFLDALASLRGASLPAAGRARLEAIARDSSCEPGLRAHALEVLDDLRVTFDLAGKRDRNPSLRAHALQLLERAGHPGLTTLARGIMNRSSGHISGLSASEKYLLQVALQILGANGELEAARMSVMLDQLDLRPRATDEFIEKVRSRARRLAEAARSESESAGQWLEREVRALVALVVRSGVHSAVDPDRPALAEGRVHSLLSPARNMGGSRSVPDLVADAVVSYLLDLPRSTGRAPGPGQAFDADPMLTEIVILELGRTRAQSAMARLRDIVADGALDYRGAACLALAATHRRAGAIHLVYALEDSDPFVRLCAYLGLKSLTHKDFFADWIYGAPADWKKAHDQYALNVVKSH